MNILMISAIDVSDTSGSVDHFTGVANALSVRGAKITVVSCCKDIGKVRLSSTIKTHFINSSSLSVFETLFRVSKKAIEIEKLNNFDILYLRVFPLDYVFLVRKLRASKAMVICELNTKIGPEYRSKNKKFRSAVYEFFEGRTLSAATAWMPVTSEIYEYAAKISGVRKPFLIARNGADFTSFHTIDIENSRSEVRQALEILDNVFVMVMLGFDRPWHGAMRAIEMLTDLPNSELWLIGSHSTRNDDLIFEFAQNHGVRKQVRIFPWMMTHDAAKYLAAADLGLSALAIDLKDLYEAQPMKVATYLYMGLPVLTNHYDSRLDFDSQFIFFEKTNDPAKLAQIAAKAKGVVSQVRIAARDYAEKNMNWESIGQEAIDFFKKLRR
jgi:glycosyltransferase involved in cell wall biosynthesis